MASKTTNFIDPTILSKAWTSEIVSIDNDNDTASASTTIQKAIQRTIPLLQDEASVPFICRYRTDIIDPLTTKQVHGLSSLLTKHESLKSLRNKLLDLEAVQKSKPLSIRVQTCTSKSELEDLYAPFKPPSKGSILGRIQNDHPKLVQSIEDFWSGQLQTIPSNFLKQSHDEIVHVVSCKIASEPIIMDVIMEELMKHCRISTKAVKGNEDTKYQNYNDYSNKVTYLKNHQVLAIRRGADQKALKLSYEIDGDKMEGCLRWNLLNNKQILNESVVSAFQSSGGMRRVLNDAIHDAWSRLLRRRGTTRLWSDKCKIAQERSMDVFQQNLYNALMAPPLQAPESDILALDPGFQAGIKCAVLNPKGNVIRLETVQFLGSKRDNAIQQLQKLLQVARGRQKNDNNIIVVALGNGTGSQECRTLVEDASKELENDVVIHLVNEAGASVWSVTEAATKQFPDQAPASIAAVSIGRRLLNPLHELVKVPPRSLGLGMYQHDLSEKELDEKLHLTTVDVVAAVGVDVNTCSIEVLEKVPGINNKLAPKIIKARPLQQRQDLIQVDGLGPKTFENCVAFCRVCGKEPLDTTLVHPESYDLARWLLKQLHWDLSKNLSDTTIPPKSQWNDVWKDIISKACQRYDVSQGRVLSVLGHLVDSMTNIDPRLRDDDNDTKSSSPSSSFSHNSNNNKIGSIRGCQMLPSNLVDSKDLKQACPLRGIIGTVRNIADFGAFVDFGGHGDGLLHISQMGTVQLDSLLIGQHIGIDIIQVQNDGQRISLALTGLDVAASTTTKSNFGNSKRTSTTTARKTTTTTTTSQRRNMSSTSTAKRSKGISTATKKNSYSAGQKRRATSSTKTTAPSRATARKRPKTSR